MLQVPQAATLMQRNGRYKDATWDSNMTRIYLALLILFIAISGSGTANFLVSIAPAAYAGQHDVAATPTEEISRLRSEAESSQIDRLNAALFFLVRRYDEDGLYSLLKGASPEWVISRGEVEEHLMQLRYAKTALHLYYEDEAIVQKSIKGLSEQEIIDLAGSLE